MEISSKKIGIVGLGYVGSSLATVLAQKFCTRVFDINQKHVQLMSRGIMPVVDDYGYELLQDTKKNIIPCDSLEMVIQDVDFLILATPTNYDERTDSFDCSSIFDTINKVLILGFQGCIVIKSTIPIGFVTKLRETFSSEKIFFSPEFLREGSAVYDNVYPSRIIVGEKGQNGLIFSQILKSVAKNAPNVYRTGICEAEAIKLFANTYLASRVAYFNELDSYCLANQLDPRDIVQGISSDPRIGDFYNNPSFGYGGYCLPKDTKQLRANFKGVKNSLIDAIVESNIVRLDYLADYIKNMEISAVGLFKLAMKSGSDNFRDSAIVSLGERLSQRGISVYIFEPLLDCEEYHGMKIVSNFDDFSKCSDLILVNRVDDPLLSQVSKKIFTRDIFGRN